MATPCRRGGTLNADPKSVREEPLVIECEGEHLLGIVSTPPAGAVPRGVGVIIVVGGPQYRAGSHRQFILLARSLSAAGYHCLRFDYRGLGDSSGSRRDFMEVDHDIGAALTAFRHTCPELRKVVLCGLCDGASASLLYLHARSQLAGITALVLINPWFRSELGLVQAQVRHYYLQRVMAPGFWLKLFRGDVGISAFTGLMSKLHKLWQSRIERLTQNTTENLCISYQERMLSAWASFPGPVLLVLSGRDLVARECVHHLTSEFRGRSHQVLMNRASTQVFEAPNADHTFSNLSEQANLEKIIAQWLSRCVSAA